MKNNKIYEQFCTIAKKLPQEALLTLINYIINNNLLKQQSEDSDVVQTYELYHMTNQLRKRLNIVNKGKCQDESLRRWYSVYSSLPKTLQVVPKITEEYLDRCKNIWQSHIFGLEEIYDTILYNIVEYSNSYQVKPTILVGTPGCGKTAVVRVFAEMLGLGLNFVKAPSVIAGRGLLGESGVYKDADCGVLAQSFIDTKCCNPVFAIDELDKVDLSNSRGAEFQHSLLSLLDDSASEVKDNFLGIELNAKHVPIICTANSLKTISEPLKDRCQIIEFPQPSKLDIQNILIKFTIPQTIKKLNCEDKITFMQEEGEYLVNKMYKDGVRSIRPYQLAVSKLVVKKQLSCIQKNISDTITAKDIDEYLKNVVRSKEVRIGF